MAAGALADAARWRRQLTRRRAVALAAVGAILAANLAYGQWRLGQHDATGPGPRVLVIQTNLPQDNKIGWPLEQQYRDFEAFTAQTIAAHAAASATGPVDLVVWPETMLSGWGLEEESIRTLVEWRVPPGDHFAAAIARLQQTLATPLLVGSAVYQGLRVVEGRFQWDAHFNSAYLLTGEGPPARYDKHFLTPFGETMPLISRSDWLEERLLAIGAAGMSFNLDASPDVQTLSLPGAAGAGPAAILVGTPICYEDTIPWLCRRMVYSGGRKRAAVLINLSNDGWFGWWDGGRAQHNQIARFRAIENRVPMARAVNTGQSLAIDSTGKAIERIGRGRYGEARQAGSLAAVLPLDQRVTLYARWGDLLGWLTMLCLLLPPGFGLLGRLRASERSRT
jgi:apolipoprotein N-acyltransferase